MQSIRDLKGKTIVATEAGDDRLFISASLELRRDGSTQGHQLGDNTDDGRVDAPVCRGEGRCILRFPTQPQELRAKKIGQVIVNTATTGHGLNTSAACSRATESSSANIRSPRRTRCVPPQGCGHLCERPESRCPVHGEEGLRERLQVCPGGADQELPYNRWREANPEDTLRFHALRLHEAGMIKSSPQKIIAQGTDWRFLNELKKELKA